MKCSNGSSTGTCAPDASADKGRGLGLAIAKGIVESQGGRLWAESQNGAGATFVIELPDAGASSA